MIEEAREHIGAGVVYNPGYGRLEDGTIVSVSDRWVHVRYGNSVKATAPSDLTLLAPFSRPIIGVERTIHG